jgi:hypothetical protein
MNKSKFLGNKITEENLNPKGLHSLVLGHIGYKKIEEFRKDREKNQIPLTPNQWKVEIKNAMTGDIDETYYFPSLSQLAERVPMFNYNTWRNIALGRSKTYNKFVNIYKIPKHKRTIYEYGSVNDKDKNKEHFEWLDKFT